MEYKYFIKRKFEMILKRFSKIMSIGLTIIMFNAETCFCNEAETIINNFEEHTHHNFFMLSLTFSTLAGFVTLAVAGSTPFLAIPFGLAFISLVSIYYNIMQYTSKKHYNTVIF